MPIATALIVAAAAYQAQQLAQKNEAADGNVADGDGAADTGRVADNQSNRITSDFLENKTSIELLPLEQSLTMLEWPISTVSFYQCASSSDLASTLDKLERRVKAVLCVNPWLGGWLVHGKGIGSSSLFDKTPRLWYDPSGNEMAKGTFQKLSHDDVPLDRDTAYLEYETILSNTHNDVIVKTNPEIVNRKDETLFRITIIPSSPNNDNDNDNDELSFALICSMSHICGDGHTFYRILKMVEGKSAIVALIPRRELLYSQQVMDLMGRQEAHYVSHLTKDPAWMKLFRMGSDVDEEESNKLHGRVFLVNRHWIGNIKASHMTDGNISDICTSTLRSPMTPAFLNALEMESSNSTQQQRNNPTQSTNDILVSWFWNLVHPHVGLMTVNFRGRLDSIAENYVGNYANPVPYTREDYKSPTLIRKSLEKCRRAGVVAGTKNAPTVLPRAHPDLTFSIITNWSSFPSFTPSVPEERACDEEDCVELKLIRHMPLIHPKQMMERMPKRMSFLIIFLSGPEDIGCMLIGPGRVMEEIDCCGVVKEKIAEF